MRMGKKLLALICAAALLLSLCSGAFAAEANDIVFSEDGATLLFYPASRTDASYTVPDNVKIIADTAFANAQLTTLTLPDGLTTIGTRLLTTAS